MNSKVSTPSIPAASNTPRLETTPPPGFEYLFGGLILLGVIFLSLASSFEDLFKDSPKLGLALATLLGFVNLTNLFRLPKSPKGGLALLAGLGIAICSSFLGSGTVFVVLATLPGLTYLTWDFGLQPMIHEHKQGGLLRSIQGVQKEDIAKVASQIDTKHRSQLVSLLLARFQDPEVAILETQLSVDLRFDLALQSMEGSQLLDRVLDLLKESDELWDRITDLQEFLAKSDLICNAAETIEAFLKSEGLVKNKAAFLFVLFQCESHRHDFQKWLTDGLELLDAHDDPVVISCMEDTLRSFDEKALAASLQPWLTRPLQGHFLFIVARFLGPEFLDVVLPYTNEDNPDVLGVVAGIFRRWSAENLLESVETINLAQAFSEVVRRIRSIHPYGENLLAD
ncbi:MAG: hypothetical protein HOI66_06190, partial [Verrucomicrobia bacterium]|nr:hypothetical protein [Verrucomicrobiota bacterium]